MKKALLVYYKDETRDYDAIIEHIFEHEMWEQYTLEKDAISRDKIVSTEQQRICNADVDILVTLDMAGFQYRTLLSNYQYNIMPVRQMHIILDEQIWKRYCDSEFAINAFVYVPLAKANGIEWNPETPNVRFYPQNRNLNMLIENFLSM